MKYHEGNFDFRYYHDEFQTKTLQKVSAAYYAIKNNHPITTVSCDIAFDAMLFESLIIPVGIRALQKLKNH